MENNFLVGTTANEYKVYNRPDKSHNHLPGDRYPGLLKKLLFEISPTADFEEITVLLPKGKTIASDCVVVNSEDQTFYWQRSNRKQATHFVLNRQPVLESKVKIVLKIAKDGASYILISCFPGAAPPETDLEFWSKHALIWRGKKPKGAREER